jgi:quercetin dioxygenase-like cupin family protein
MRALMLCGAVLLMALPVGAQDAVAVDPAHHKVEFENDQVRVLRVTLAPGEKTPSHSHPAGVAVFLNDSKNRLIIDGKADAPDRKAGHVAELQAVTHVVENVGTTKSEVIVIELKGKPATAPK